MFWDWTVDWLVVRGVWDPRLLRLVLSAAYQVSSQPTKLEIKIDLFSRPDAAAVHPRIIKGDINHAPQYNDYLIKYFRTRRPYQSPFSALILQFSP